jgi:hypothetical protein
MNLRMEDRESRMENADDWSALPSSILYLLSSFIPRLPSHLTFPPGLARQWSIEVRATSFTAARPRRILTAFPSPEPFREEKHPAGFAAA